MPKGNNRLEMGLQKMSGVPVVQGRVSKKQYSGKGVESGGGREGFLREIKTALPGFPGGAVVGSPPANAGDMGSSPGWGGSHVPRSN